MAPRRSACETNFTIEIFKGAACSESFQFTNPDDTPIDISGFIFTLILKNVFDDTFQLISGDPPTTLGSFLEITDGPNGRFAFTLSDEETDEAEIGTGRWAIQVDEGDGYPYILYRDSAVVREI